MRTPLPDAPPVQATATWYAVVGGNDQYWRIDAPAKAVGGKVIAVPENAEPTRDERGRFSGREPSAFYSMQTPNNDSMFPWEFLVDQNNPEGWERGDPDSWEIRFPSHEGSAAVWTRPDLARATLALAMRYKLGIRTVAENDDNYIGNPNKNVFMRQQMVTRDEALQHLKGMASMSAVVFSTTWLRDRYEKAFRKRLKLTRKWLPEMYVCGNHVDEADWPTRVERDGPVRVGWMGSPSHVWDINLAYNTFRHAKELGCETWMIGYNPAKADIYEGLPLYDEAVRRRDKWAGIVDHHIDWVKPAKYQRFAMPLDIGVAPLETNGFTLGKSDVKAIEYAICGAAPVLWNMPVYNKNWKHGETCLLVRDDYEAGLAVQALVRDENLRERIVKGAQQYVREERGLKQLRQEWESALNG